MSTSIIRPTTLPSISDELVSKPLPADEDCIGIVGLGYVPGREREDVGDSAVTREFRIGWIFTGITASMIGRCGSGWRASTFSVEGVSPVQR